VGRCVGTRGRCAALIAEPKFILNVMKTYPDLFSDLPPIPTDVAITPGFVFKP
jgi:hypothetical protein